MPRHARATAEQVAEDLRDVVSALRRRVRAEASDDARALPYPLRSALKRLETDGPQTTADLARSELITPQSAGALVAQLEARAFIVRHADKTDGRRQLISLTATGRKTIAAARKETQSWLAQEIATHMSDEERQTIATALGLLRRIVDP